MESTDDSLSESSHPGLKVELPLTHRQDADLEKNEPLPSHSAQKEGVAQGPGVDDKDAYLVKFDEGDPNNPINFPPVYKIWLVLQMSMLAFCGLGGASIIAPSVPTVARYLNTSIEVQVLMIALFLLGFSLGPLVWAPISEVYGRRWSMLPAVFIYCLFSIGTATSTDAASIFVTRFFAGIFGSAPVTIGPAALADFFSPRTRGIATAFFVTCVIGGPILSPIIGASLTINPYLGWRWTEYMEAIISFFIFAVTLVCLPETYHPLLLKNKAQHLRNTTRMEQYWHPHENEKLDLNNTIAKHLNRPLRMLFTEPMVALMSLYSGFVYSLLFLTLEVFPIVFGEQRQYSLVVSTLPFLGIFVGVLCGTAINIGNQPWYARAVKMNKGLAVPEARLPPMILGGILFSIGLFWFGWTAAPRFHWALPVVAAGFIGAGFNVVFQQSLNFLIDAYGPFASSAIASNTFLRSLLACAMPLAARPMFLNMGVGPAASLLGAISCLALPVPFMFMNQAKLTGYIAGPEGGKLPTQLLNEPHFAYKANSGIDVSIMAFEIQPLNAIADLEEIIKLMVVTLNIQEPMKTILGNASPEDKWTILSHSIRDWFSKPGAVGFKMVESSTNKIVSFFIIQRPHSMTDSEKAAGSSSMEYPPGMNKELATEFHGISVGLRRRNGFDPARDYSGSIIATLPDYQGQGHGRRLVELGLKMADTEGKTCRSGLGSRLVK
ncbi:hypothetical protein V500_11285 [Pseudogymnoascus sp. VKM F-4518 (FW-2643)]|nr:hypothetical protein V500_11285 [Pseudogymnoascus sp. VKM F-4518 (FW-2643)]